MFEVSAGYAQHSILIFHVIPSCPERGQQVKRNPNLNSAEVLCAACFKESGINKNKNLNQNHQHKESLLTFFQESPGKFLLPKEMNISKSPNK
ncbi:MAG: hypothetical protein LIO50_07165 [Phascolarctobacterium sp.]|uniref:hypothetical protein n=1 Tax=Phascolarctobacterium sp. TaxID=2049039 RepID=UPI0025E1D51E|nr:hypothetical protein [Phascolarctobacterium sp.]MCC8158983.1 hypothetical protein [Phascolarctobacterium sp.]